VTNKLFYGDNLDVLRRKIVGSRNGTPE